jgi:hypothetical protein
MELHYSSSQEKRLTRLLFRGSLAKPAAEDWATQCRHFAGRLESAGLSLEEGIQCVKDWLWELRRLLRDIGVITFLPVPDGEWPTPTHPAKPPSSHGLSSRDEDDNRRMREALKRVSNGKNATPKAVINEAEIGVQRGRRALRRLQESGEYEGFARCATKAERSPAMRRRGML